MSVDLTEEQRAVAEALAEKDGTSLAHIVERAIRIGMPKVQQALEALYKTENQSPTVTAPVAAVAETGAGYSAKKKGVA